MAVVFTGPSTFSEGLIDGYRLWKSFDGRDCSIVEGQRILLRGEQKTPAAILGALYYRFHAVENPHNFIPWEL